MTSHKDTHVNRSAIGVHHRETLWTIRGKDISVLPHIGVKDENYSVLLRTIQQSLIHNTRMLNSPAGIGTRILRFGTLDRGEDHVYLAVAVRVRRNLPSSVPPLLKIFVQLLLCAGGWNTKVVL